MSRESRDSYFLRIASVVASRGTCRRRRVGAILVDSRRHIIATGYNGTPAGFPHCLDHECPGARSVSGTHLDGCFAIHAEANALLQCSDVSRIDTCYSTASPCISCTKLLLNTGCRRICFLEEYPHPEAKQLWLSQNNDPGVEFLREWLLVTISTEFSSNQSPTGNLQPLSPT